MIHWVAVRKQESNTISEVCKHNVDVVCRVLLPKEDGTSVMFLPVFVCLSLCRLDYSKTL